MIPKIKIVKPKWSFDLCKEIASCYKSKNELKKSNINLNRKMLSQLAILDPTTFNKIVKQITI